MTLEEHDRISVAILGEGKHDVFFLHELIINTLKFQIGQVGYYEKIGSLQRDLSSGRQKRITISGDNGYELPMTVCNIVEDFWYKKGQDRILVVGDTDTGRVYDKIDNCLTPFINNRNPKPYVRPVLSQYPKEKKFTVELKNGRIVTIWTAEITISLEAQIRKALQATYDWIPKKLNDDETMDFACKKLDLSVEKLIRDSVNLLTENAWLKALCNKINQIIPK